MAKRKFGINLPTKIIFVASVTLLCFGFYRFRFENYASIRKRKEMEKEINILYEKQIESNLSKVKIN